MSQHVFDRLLAEHERDVLRVSRSVTRDAHLAADAAQETFLRLWQRLQSGLSPERPGAWLQRVAVHAALDQRRARARRAETLEPLDEGAPLARAEDAAEHALLGRELSGRYERALATLSEGQRVVFLLKHEGGLTLAQAADALELALPTVKTQFARACLKLARALSDERG